MTPESKFQAQLLKTISTPLPFIHPASEKNLERKLAFALPPFHPFPSSTNQAPHAHGRHDNPASPDPKSTRGISERNAIPHLRTTRAERSKFTDRRRRVSTDEQRFSPYRGGVHLDRDFASRKACWKTDSGDFEFVGESAGKCVKRIEGKCRGRDVIPLSRFHSRNRRRLSRGVVGNSRRAKNFELSCRTRQAGRAPPDLGLGLFFGLGVPAGLSGFADSNPSRVNRLADWTNGRAVLEADGPRDQRPG